MVIHVGNVRARLHDTGGRGGFRTGACSLQLMPHWIENFLPVHEKVANKYQNNHSVRQEIGIVDKHMRDSRQSKMASTMIH